MKELALSVLRRFARAFAAGAVSQMLIIAQANGVTSFTDVNAWLTAVIVGGVTGGLMAADKLLRYELPPENL